MKMKKIATTALASAAFMVVGAGVAMAALTTEYPGGGIWNHGFDQGFVVSDYWHPDKCHSSTVQGRDTVWSGPQPGGEWAYAHSPEVSGVDKAWWNDEATGC